MHFTGPQSYGSINSGYDGEAVTSDGRWSPAAGFTEEPTDEYDSSFLHHSLPSTVRNGSCPLPVSQQGPATQSPYMSSANEGRSSGEHLYDQPDLSDSPTGRASTMLISWNLMNLLLGTGILALPFAVFTGGVVVIALAVVIAVAAYYTGRILVRCLYETKLDPTGRQVLVKVRRDYVELGQDASDSVVGGWVVHILQSAEMVAVCVLNLIVLGQLCHEIFPRLSIKVCTVIGASFSFPTVFVRKIQLVAWMQLAGILSLAVALLLIQGYCLINMSSWQIDKIPIYDVENLSIASGILIYSFGIHPVLPGIEEHMRRPERYNLVLFLAIAATCLIQYLFGFSNAALYTTNTRQLITVDLQHHFNLGVASAVFVFLSVVCCFALPTYVVMERIDNGLVGVLPWFGRDSTRHFVLAVLVRLMIIGFSLVVAVMLPYFAYVMGFVGCSVSAALSLILPCVFHLKIKARQLRWHEYVCDIAIIFCGVFCMVVGTYHAIRAVN